MELLERGPSLALLAGYAAEARRGDGRLVLVSGEAGVGKTALLERFQRDLADARWFWERATACSLPVPSAPCTSWPIGAPNRNAAAAQAARLGLIP
jgi:AAA ATPase domain